MVAAAASRSDQVSLDEHIEQHGDTPASDVRRRARPGAGTQGTGVRASGKRWNALPFDQRTAIVLREIDGLSYDEIAFSLGVAIGTVKSRLTRAREALRAELREARAV